MFSKEDTTNKRRKDSLSNKKGEKIKLPLTSNVLRITVVKHFTLVVWKRRIQLATSTEIITIVENVTLMVWRTWLVYNVLLLRYDRINQSCEIFTSGLFSQFASFQSQTSLDFHHLIFHSLGVCFLCSKQSKAAIWFNKIKIMLKN